MKTAQDKYWDNVTKGTKSMSISALDKKQWGSVAKAIGYAFVSTFVTTLLVQPELGQAALYASAVAAVNACLVVIKKLFTEVE